MEIRCLVSLALQPRTSVLLLIFLSAGSLSPKQPPCPALMTYFSMTVFSGVHQCVLAFTLERYVMICAPDYLGEWFERSDHNVPWWWFAHTHAQAHKDKSTQTYTDIFLPSLLLNIFFNWNYKWRQEFMIFVVRCLLYIQENKTFWPC